MGLLSLLILALVIFIAYKKGINTGLLGVMAAFLFGFVLTTPTSGGEWVPVSSAAGKASVLLKGWNSGMFLTLLGVTFLFGIARANNTLLILTQYLVRLVGGRKWLLPIAVFVVSFIISVIGPGPINGMAIIAPIAGQIAYTEKVKPLLMMIATACGNLSGGLTPLSPSGVVALSYAERGGINLGYNLLLNIGIAFTAMFIIAYIVLGGWKDYGKGDDNDSNKSMHMKKENYITLGIIGVVIFVVILFNLNIGFTALSGAVILLLLGVTTEKEALATVPWGTIIMVCGMGIMVSTVSHAGGITYLTNALTPFINSDTATPIMVASAAMMSSVASAMGVVMPTLIPVAIGLGNNLGIEPSSLIYGVVLGAHLSTVSPFSTLGALSLSSVDESVDKHKMFVQLIEWAILFSVIGMVLSYFKILLYY